MVRQDLNRSTEMENFGRKAISKIGSGSYGFSQRKVGTWDLSMIARVISSRNQFFRSATPFCCGVLGQEVW